MSVWSVYESRMGAYGASKRTTDLNRGMYTYSTKVPDSLSYQTVTIFDQNHSFNIRGRNREYAITQNVAIINSDNLNEKTILSLPGEHLEAGCLVMWSDNYWLITEKDANQTVYDRCKMLQCNHLLKWLLPDATLIEQWCVVEDGTKYLTGEFENNTFVVTRGDTRIYLTIGRNKQTVLLNRENRFLIDDDDTPHKLAYQLSKPLKSTSVYNKQGVYKFVLQEVTGTHDDNHELGIADYYKYFPKPDPNPDPVEPEPEPDTGDEETTEERKRWL